MLYSASQDGLVIIWDVLSSQIKTLGIYFYYLIILAEITDLNIAHHSNDFYLQAMES